MFYPYFSYITYGLKFCVAVLGHFVRMILLKVRGWLRIEIGEGVILIGWQRVLCSVVTFVAHLKAR